jgi:hypothetical protein
MCSWFYSLQSIGFSIFLLASDRYTLQSTSKYVYDTSFFVSNNNIPGPSNPKAKINVYLQPLIDELKLLWSEGVLTYDI